MLKVELGWVNTTKEEAIKRIEWALVVDQLVEQSLPVNRNLYPEHLFIVKDNNITHTEMERIIGIFIQSICLLLNVEKTII